MQTKAESNLFRLNASLALTLALLFLLSTADAVPMSVSLTPQRSFCFSEDLPRHSLVKFQASNSGLPFRAEIMYVWEPIHNAESSEKFSYSFTTQNFGIYRFCLTNMGVSTSSVWFELLSGYRAKDYGSHTENQDYVDSIENQARIADMFISQIQEENQEGLEIMSSDSVVAQVGYSLEYFFSTIFVGATLLLAYTQYNIIRNYMATRKYI